MDLKLKEALKKDVWNFFWSGNWPVFDQSPFFSETYFSEIKKAINYVPYSFVCFHKNFVTSIFQSDIDSENLSNAINKTFDENPKFALNKMQEYEERVEKDISNIKKLLDINFFSLSDLEIANLLMETRKFLEYNNGFIDLFDDFIERYLTPRLEKWLGEKLKTDDSILISEKISVLIRPHEKSPYYIERNKFFEIVDDIKKEDNLVVKIKNGDSFEILNEFPLIKKKLVDHIKNHGYLRVVVNAKHFSLEDYWKEIQLFVKDGKEYFIEETRMGDNFDSNFIDSEKRLMKKLNPNEKIKTLIKSIRRAVRLRVLDNEVQGRSTTMCMDLYNEICKRLNIKYQEMKLFLPKEISDFLINGMNKQKLSIRKNNLFVYYRYKNDMKLLDTVDAQEMKNILEHSSEIENKKYFKGIIASKGIVTAKVRVALNYKDAENIKEGEILVSHSTSAYFVGALRKASGVITETGSLGSHSSIVSRENGVPCIIGIKDITKNLKTGGLVELNANEGYVRIL